jgi:hypothetical protein
MASLKCSLLLIITLFIWSNSINAQELDLTKITDSIKTEADILYKSEWASWYGTDVFVEKCKSKQTLSGGYLSYDTGNGLNNVFFSRDTEPKILATISFGYDYNNENYKLDTTERKFTKQEKDLYTIRQTVIADMRKDTIYKYYNNTNLNAVPIITKNEKKVYVLTGPTLSGVVIFGNDYLITFDKNNNIISKKTLHKNIIPANYTKAGFVGKDLQVASVHSHLPETGDFITATDICALRLYEKFTSWNQYYIMSKNFVSIWDCKKNNLAVMTMEGWKKIGAIKNALNNTPGNK